MIDGKNPKFLRSLQNAQHDTTNLAVNFFCVYCQKIDTPESLIVLFFLLEKAALLSILKNGG